MRIKAILFNHLIFEYIFHKWIRVIIKHKNYNRNILIIKYSQITSSLQTNRYFILPIKPTVFNYFSIKFISIMLPMHLSPFVSQIFLVNFNPPNSINCPSFWLRKNHHRHFINYYSYCFISKNLIHHLHHFTIKAFSPTIIILHKDSFRVFNFLFKFVLSSECYFQPSEYSKHHFPQIH